PARHRPAGRPRRDVGRSPGDLERPPDARVPAAVRVFGHVCENFVRIPARVPIGGHGPGGTVNVGGRGAQEQPRSGTLTSGRGSGLPGPGLPLRTSSGPSSSTFVQGFFAVTVR